MVAAAEAISETGLLFCGWILPPPEISLFLMNGMFLVPGFVDMLIYAKHSHKSKYGKADPLKSNEGKPGSSTKPCSSLRHFRNRVAGGWCSKRSTVLNAILQVVGLLFQLVGILLACVFVSLVAMETAPVMTWIVLGGTAGLSLLLSTIWVGRVQQLLEIPNLNTLSTEYKEYAKKNNFEPTARWKASKHINCLIATNVLACTFLNVIVASLIYL